MFGSNQKTEEIESLRALLREADNEQRRLSQALAHAHEKLNNLQTELEAALAEVILSRKKVERMRARQKNSVERANRFKKQIQALKNNA